MNILQLISIERQKQKRRFNTLLLLCIVLAEMLFLYMNHRTGKEMEDGWKMIFYNLAIMNTLFLPVMISVHASRLMEPEHKGDMLKCLYTLCSKKQIFLSKFLYGIIPVCLMILCQCLAVPGISILLHFPVNFDLKYLLIYGISVFCSCLSLFLMHLLLSGIFRNQAVSVSVGLIGSFAGLFSAFLPPSLFQMLLPWSSFLNHLFIRLDWDRETDMTAYTVLPTEIRSFFPDFLWITVFLFLFLFMLGRAETEEKVPAARFSGSERKIRLHRRPVEILKLKGSPAWYAFFIIPLISAIIGTINYLGNLAILKDGWYSLWTQHTLFLCYFFMPVIIGVFEGCLWRIEHTGANMNLLLTRASAVKIILGKYAASVFITTLSMFWILILYFAAGFFCHLPGSLPPAIPFWLFYGLIGACAIVSVQLLLSLVIRNFVLPVILAFLGGILGIVFIHYDLSYYLPYSLFAIGMTSQNSPNGPLINLPLFLACSALFIACFLGLSILYLRFSDVKTHE
ncbi:MAG: ABC transporter permease [Lachnospiraceae bacterium]|nr:ABC transporter permease [Lachnospiraceae bacterium]